MNTPSSDLKNTWDYYQNETPEIFENSYPRMRFLIKNIKPGQKVLNIGVGGGIFESIGISIGVDIHALDPSEKSISNLRNQFSFNEKFKVGYSNQIPFTNNLFDVVVMSEVLEHLSEKEFNETLNEVYRVLAPSGRFIGTVPCEEDLTDNMVVCPHCDSKFHRWEHKQSFDHAKIRQLFSSKFIVEKLQNKLFVNWKNQKLKRRYHLLKTRILYFFRLNKPSGEMIYFSAQKRSQ